MKVKICGIRDLETAQYAIRQGADALGFVFAESKRRVTREHAKEIIANIPLNVMKVGVFVNEKADVIEDIVEEIGLTAVQLHGDEAPEDCLSYSVPVIKALSISSEDDIQKIAEYPCEYILLDSPKGKYRGGNGIAFDWELLKSGLPKNKKIILAGGLQSKNVEEAIKKATPYMVDVSSGVETDGKKDLVKIKSFINKAKKRRESHDIRITR